MKKYKLIKIYPGSPILGFIKERNDFMDFEFLEDCFLEFWEKIIKKDYEILSFRGRISNALYELDNEGLYRNKALFCPINYSDAINNEYSIHSVRRTVDGEVFTVGDKIDRQDGRYKKDVIRGFSIDSTDILLVSISDSIDASYCGGKGCNLHVIDHSETPLLTTEDGVDIFKGDLCIGVRDDFTSYQINTTGDFHYIHKLNFSTKEAAKEYILMNKPCLSMRDLKNTVYLYPNQWDTIVDYVKQLKLNL